MLPVAVSGAMAILSPDPPCDAEVISIALHTTDQNLAKECLMPLPHIGSNGFLAVQHVALKFWVANMVRPSCCCDGHIQVTTAAYMKQ